MTSTMLISDEPRIQAHYEVCLENGCSHALAEALAFRQGPALRTDVSLLQGHSNGNQFAKTPAIGNAYAMRAKAAGVSIQGKIYLSGLARFPGDPRAWVSDRNDVQKVLERNNWTSQGVVNVRAKEPESPPAMGSAHAIAPDIVEAEVEATIAENPEVAPTPKEKADLREKITSKRKPHWRK